MSSVSRTELETMDRDELIEHIVALDTRVDDLEREDALDPLELAAVRLLVTNLADLDDQELDENSLIDCARAAVDRVDDLADRIDDLETENDRLRQRLETVQPTTEGVDGLVAYAQRKRNGEDIVTLSPAEIQGAYDCSEGYAYKLANGEYVVDEYDWLLPGDELRQYGELELDGAAAPKRLSVDFAGQQSSGVPLKHYNNDSTEEGV